VLAIADLQRESAHQCGTQSSASNGVALLFAIASTDEGWSAFGGWRDAAQGRLGGSSRFLTPQRSIRVCSANWKFGTWTVSDSGNEANRCQRQALSSDRDELASE